MSRPVGDLRPYVSWRQRIKAVASHPNMSKAEESTFSLVTHFLYSDAAVEKGIYYNTEMHYWFALFNYIFA